MGSVGRRCARWRACRGPCSLSRVFVWCMIASARLREARLATMALLFAALLAGTLLAAPQLIPS